MPSRGRCVTFSWLVRVAPAKTVSPTRKLAEWGTHDHQDDRHSLARARRRGALASRPARVSGDGPRFRAAQPAGPHGPGSDAVDHRVSGRKPQPGPDGAAVRGVRV